MNLKMIIKSNKITYLILFVITLLVIISSTYCPFNFRRMHVDSSNYVSIAQGINRGYLPYKDFIDNKGPLTYLISAAGLKLGGFTGIWIIELILMFVSVFFAYKTALFFGKKIIAMLSTFFTFIVMLAFFSVNAGTGEYSLPFMMISLFIFTKYFFSEKRETSFISLIILGFCFAFAIMLQLNMFPIWAGFCLIIFFETLIAKKYFLLIKYITGFCLGCIIIFLPIYLYLVTHNILNDFFTQVVIGGASRGFSSSGIKDVAKNFFIVVGRNNSILPIFIGFFWIITNYKKHHFNYYLAYTFAAFLSVIFISFSSGDGHYNMILVPFFIPAIVFLANLIETALSEKKYKFLLLIMLFCILFSEGLVKYIYDISKIVHNKSGTELINAGKMIDMHTNPDDKIISLGFNGYIYPFTKRNTASKYIYQGSGLDHIPGAKDEFISDILTAKPAIVALFNAEDGIGQIMKNWHEPVFEMIETDYRVISTENGFILWIRNY